jgi:hypothetical protein
MSTSGLLLTVALAAGVLVSPPLPAQETAASRPTRAEMEAYLRTAKIVRQREIGKGVTRPYRATMTDGKLTHDAHIQSVDVTRSEFKTDRTVELNFKDSYKFNIAAYRLGLLLGIENIPVSVERKVDGKTSAVTWWVDDVMMDETARRARSIAAPDMDLWNRRLHVVRVFDQLIYNTDRNLGNLLITKNWDVWMIDHTRAFRIRTDLRDPKNLQRCERGLLERMRALNKADLAGKLKPFLNSAEIDALLARRDRIVKVFDDEIKTKGEEAVLYDLK